MFPIGHLGLAAGAVKIFETLNSKSSLECKDESGSVYLPDNSRGRGKIDYRLVMLGSLLPDIIDKPLWLISQTELFPSGRSYAHTLLFGLLLFIGCLILLQYKKTWLMTISLSSLSHFVLDGMWLNPATLWWPLGGQFRKVAVTAGWTSGMIQPLIINPEDYLLEILGELVALVIILLLTYRLIVKKGVTRFIKTGTIP